MMWTDPHDFHNRLLLANELTYKDVGKEHTAAMQRGDTEEAAKLTSQLRETEVTAFETRREMEREGAKVLLKTGAIVGTVTTVSALTASTGTAAVFPTWQAPELFPGYSSV